MKKFFKTAIFGFVLMMFITSCSDEFFSDQDSLGYERPDAGGGAPPAPPPPRPGDGGCGERCSEPPPR